VGGLALAIGPHYFSASAFWSYEDGLTKAGIANKLNIGEANVYRVLAAAQKA